MKGDKISTEWHEVIKAQYSFPTQTKRTAPSLTTHRDMLLTQEAVAVRTPCHNDCVNNNTSQISKLPKEQILRVSQKKNVNDRYANCLFNRPTMCMCHSILSCHINIHDYRLLMKMKQNKEKSEEQRSFLLLKTETEKHCLLDRSALCWAFASWFIIKGIKEMNKFKGEINDWLFCHSFSSFLEPHTHQLHKNIEKKFKVPSRD